MKIDKFGRQILSENDICHLYLSNTIEPKSIFLVEDSITFDDELELQEKPKFKILEEFNSSVEDFDKKAQSNWFMPEDYKSLDIAEWVLFQCKTDAEIKRAGEELLLYQDRDLFPMLRYLKFLVDTMRSNNIVWGVGRGSSVASFVLFLIGVHKIDSLKFNLDIREFIK